MAATPAPHTTMDTHRRHHTTPPLPLLRPRQPRALRTNRSPSSAIVARARLLVSAKCCPRSMSRRLAAVKVSISREEVRVVYLQCRGSPVRQYEASDTAVQQRHRAVHLPLGRRCGWCTWK